jgi:hypothetical protein
MDLPSCGVSSSASPQKDDADSAHERSLLLALQKSLQRFCVAQPKDESLEILAVVSYMLETMIAIHDPQGELNSKALKEALQNLSAAGNGKFLSCLVARANDLLTGCLLLHIKAQNAGLMLKNQDGAVTFEAFELSPTNAAVTGTKGKLRRQFSDVCCAIEASTASFYECKQRSRVSSRR